MQAALRAIAASYESAKDVFGLGHYDLSIFKNFTLGPVPWAHFKSIWVDIGPKLAL